MSQTSPRDHVASGDETAHAAAKHTFPLVTAIYNTGTRLSGLSMDSNVTTTDITECC
jgi:hypothetical protein